MSFIESKTDAPVYAPGYFLASEDCKRITTEIAQSGATTVGTAKVVKSGTVYPSNDGNAIGIVYEDVDVTSGDMAGSIVTDGVIYEDRLPASVESSAKAVLTGIRFISSAPAVTRPAWLAGDMDSLSVNSVAGATSGKTAITTGYTLKSGEAYKYKTDASTAPTVGYGETPDGWTSWDGTSDITATTSHKISVCVVDRTGVAVALGSATVTSKT
jgi:hypothetical protein